MRVSKRITVPIVWLAMTLTLEGCQTAKEPVRVDPQSQPVAAQPLGQDASKRFQEAAPSGRTAVESAIELSEKYARLADETAGLRKDKQTLVADNQRLSDDLAVCRTQTKQTQKELAEANDLLIEMRIELNSWKADILGFRDEMREANKAQLEALLKILKALGGELPAETPQSSSAGSAAPPPTEPNQPQQPKQ